MAFLDLVSELTGETPGLSPLLARRYINRALSAIYGERLWSFLTVDAAIVCPTQIIDGTVAITQYSDTVTCDADASAVLLAQSTPGATPGIQQMSIRFGTGAAAVGTVGQIYNILAADITTPTAIVFTLNRVVMEATDAAATYQCYRPYITAPITDFLKWVTVVDMANGYTIWDGRATHTSAEFDVRDPQRQSQGLAYYLGSYAGGYVSDPITGTVVPLATVNSGDNIWELWPHPTSGQTFYCRFQRRGAVLVSPTDTQPAAISDELILHRAKGWYVYPWAQGNVANLPQLKGANWPTLIADARRNYKDEMRECKRNDDEAALQTVMNRGHGLRGYNWNFKGLQSFPIDSNYIQSHLVNI